MRAFLFTVAFAAVQVAAHNCNSFTVTEVSDVCPEGYDLAPITFIEQCLADVCPKLSPWTVAKYADSTKVLVGPAYNSTCGPATYEGRPLGAAVCVPGTCEMLFSVNNKACPDGTHLAPAAIVTYCMGQLCHGLGLNAAYHYDDPTMMVVGRGLQRTCGPVANNVTASAPNSLCFGAF